MKFKVALVSVSDKSGLVEFLRPLADAGTKIISTGGTARHLQDNGIKVCQVSDITGFPEVMDGRVRTLHPKIHMPLLARSHVNSDLQLLKEYEIDPIDLVVGNLYPFEQALQQDLELRQQMEKIDIGGPALLRAAAKNFESITVVCDPQDYEKLNQLGEIGLEERQALAAKVFAHISAYDSMVSTYLDSDPGPDFGLGGRFVQHLRYGENPHQQGFWYRRVGANEGLHNAEVVQGKPLSFNNLQDLDSACRCLGEFSQPAVVSVKHANPCGVGIGKDIDEAVVKSLKADPVSVFGGIVAVNRKVGFATAKQLTSLFLECVVAPDYNSDALAVFQKKKNLRVLVWPGFEKMQENWQVKTISGGLLVQSPDSIDSWSSNWEIRGQKPDADIRRDIELAWKVCAHLKSNAIAIAGGGQTLGLGMGQVNRVDAVEQAILRAKAHHSITEASVLASDAFFPFADSVEKAADAGIQWIIQPGGSIRDEDVFAAAERLGVTLILTGKRHFQH